MGQTIAFVPARGSSKRIPRKNLCLVGEHSLLERALRCAVAAKVSRIVVSTDCEQIAGHAETALPGVEVHFAGAPLHTDTAQIEEAIHHWLRCTPEGASTVHHTDVIVLEQCTSPFRRPETIRRCVDLVRSGCDSAVTVTLDVRNTGRVRGLFDPKTGDDVARRTIWDRPVDAPRVRSQDARPHAIETGTVYAFSVAHFLKTKNRMGGREASVPIHWVEAVEIDDARDLAIARALAPHVDALLAMEGT